MIGNADVPRLVPPGALKSLSTTLRATGKRIVSVVGSFDLLHNGHLHVLDAARTNGDVVVVGLRSDASIRSSKGPDRPHLLEPQRAEMLLALRAVDYVHIIDDLPPLAFLEALRPHVHVSGSESGEDSPERVAVTRGGGRIHIVEKVRVLSRPDLSQSLQPRSV